MLKLKFSKPVFHTYNGGDITVCRFQCIVMQDGVPCDSFQSQGVAKRAKEDALNPVLGRHLAESRAKEKAYNKVRKAGFEAYCLYHDLACTCWEDYVKFLKLTQTENAHIEKLLSE